MVSSTSVTGTSITSTFDGCSEVRDGAFVVSYVTSKRSVLFSDSAFDTSGCNEKSKLKRNKNSICLDFSCDTSPVVCYLFINTSI